jgi:hypothetical protein
MQTGVGRRIMFACALLRSNLEATSVESRIRVVMVRGVARINQLLFRVSPRKTPDVAPPFIPSKS